MPCTAQTREQYRYVSQRPRPSPPPPLLQLQRHPHNFPARASVSAPPLPLSPARPPRPRCPVSSSAAWWPERKKQFRCLNFSSACVPSPLLLRARPSPHSRARRSPLGQQPEGSTAPGQMFRSCRSVASERRLRAPAARVSAVAAGRVLGAPQPGSDSSGSGLEAGGRGAGKVRGKAEADTVRVRGQSRWLCRNMAVVERPVAWGGGAGVAGAAAG